MAEPSNPPTGEASTATISTDPKARIVDLTARASQKYSMKDYNEASDLYAQASELQAELNGEMALENAELLYLYGRSLYQVGVSKSDVLGGKASGDAGATGSNKKETNQKEGKSTTAPAKGEDTTEEATLAVANKPYFQFTGDENLAGSDDEENGDEEAGVGEDDNADAEEDDFTSAWESLDLARLLFDRKLQSLLEKVDGEEATESSPEVRYVKERLADAHDLLAEISLEHENFVSAVVDLRASLSLKEELYPQESGMIAEAHYKLSLALEFGSTSTAADDGEKTELENQLQFDQAGRDEAAQHMEAAIESGKLRLQKDEGLLNSKSSDEQTLEQKKKGSKESIEDLKEMIADMEQRLIDLRAPPVSIDPATGAPTDAGDSSHSLAGILSSVLGATPAEQKAKLEEVMKGANDLSGLVKRKKPATDAKVSTPDLESGLKEANGPKKRKAEESTDAEETELAKKSKVEGTSTEGRNGVE
ncbi:MAG: hypothetical protein M1816_006484 [Peltula sp. TS41687]|nr:MAG: hypothetical protein M1816_006484 [Peltula sp. TS41687]